ncbi:ferritin-like domain-containing protein [Nostoc sp.]|uniref:ferritin-like domain-containing protein n=1 Tax=Nostoc sp. TaxID=1180 RepID=UPI002FF9B27D
MLYTFGVLMNPHKLLPTLPSITTSDKWYTYYKANAEFQLEIPWKRGAEITEDERNAIGDSLAAWQLGETSDGLHLLAAAKNYAQYIKDPRYVDVIELFIKEEQRHGGDLGRFLDLAQIPRLQHNWGDTLFRKIRYAIPTMEIWTTPVIMVETLALVYYKAIQNATNSAVLKQLCQQILRDEVKHIRFQYERLAIIQKNRPAWLRKLIYLIQQLLYYVPVILVWMAHHRALRAGGHSFKSYWRDAWVKMNFAWERMKPERYQ